MGFPVCPTQTNAFLYLHEKTWLNESPKKFKLYTRKNVQKAMLPIMAKNSRVQALQLGKTWVFHL